MFSVYPFYLWLLREYTLCLIITIKSEVWNIHCLWLGHEQWYALHVSLYSYEFVIWPDCVVGHSCPGGICPETGPVTDMQHYCHTRYLTYYWHLAYMFSLVYFSVDVCLVGVFPHSARTRRDPCVMVCAPLILASPSRENKKNQTGLTRLSTWSKWGGIWIDALACLHYRVVIWVVGYFNSPLILHSVWGVP